MSRRPSLNMTKLRHSRAVGKNISLCVIDKWADEMERKARAKKHLAELTKIHERHKKSAQQDCNPN